MASAFQLSNAQGAVSTVKAHSAFKAARPPKKSIGKVNGKAHSLGSVHEREDEQYLSEF